MKSALPNFGIATIMKATIAGPTGNVDRHDAIASSTVLYGGELLHLVVADVTSATDTSRVRWIATQWVSTLEVLNRH